MKLALSRVAEFLSASGEFDHEAVAQGYSIDSRTIQPGELFFAVKGERMDGHDFVSQALEKGAAAAVIRRDQLARYASKTGLITVDDTLGCAADPGQCGSAVVGKAAHRGDRIDGKDHHERSHRARAFDPLPSAEIRRQLQ